MGKEFIRGTLVKDEGEGVRIGRESQEGERGEEESWAIVTWAVQPRRWRGLESVTHRRSPASCGNGPALVSPPCSVSLAGSCLWKCGLQVNVGVGPKCQPQGPSIIHTRHSSKSEWCIFMATASSHHDPYSQPTYITIVCISHESQNKEVGSNLRDNII